MNIEKMLPECRAHWEKTKPDAVFPDYWLGWQASRESLVITLPAKRHELEVSGEDLVPDENGSLIYLHDLIEHLEALGLKVRL